MVPTVKLPLGMEFTSQVTAGLLAFSTFAVNCTVPPAATCVAGADTVTVAAGGVIGAGAGAGSPPAVATQETRASGASKIPRKKTARFQPARGRRCPREDGNAVPKSM